MLSYICCATTQLSHDNILEETTYHTIDESWTTLEKISDEIQYRSNMSVNPSFTSTEIRTQIIPVLKYLMKYHGFNALKLDQELVERRLYIHIYAIPLEQGSNAIDPGSKFLHRFMIRIYPGTMTAFQRFLIDEIKIKPDDHINRLRDCGFEEVK